MSERPSLTEEALGRGLRALTEEHARERQDRDAERAWDRVMSTGFQRRAPRRHRAVLALAAALAICGLVLAIGYFRAPDPLAVNIAGAELSGGVFRTAATGGHVDFSDDSRVVVSPGAAFTVEVVGPHAALTRLLSGALHVKVAHREETDYRFFAGPYEVRVVGTEFDLSWEPASESFQLVMREGEVKVLTPDRALRSVRAGERLELRGPKLTPFIAEELLPGPGRSEGSATPARPAASSAAEVPNRDERPASAQVSTAASGAPRASWSSLVAKGQFAAVVREAEAGGVEQALGARPAADVKALGQAARYVGQSSLSLRAWLAVRERFPRSPEGQEAAFFLGRTAEEQGRSAEALRWLDTYLAESPRGAYVAEASGRRMTLLSRMLGNAGARSAAQSYLERYPAGAYAGAARAILSER